MKTPEQIVAELRADPLRWMNDWSESDEPEIGLDGAYTLDELRAIVAVREKQLGLPDPIQEAAMQCVRLLRAACRFEMWQEQGDGVAEQIKREFGVSCKRGS